LQKPFILFVHQMCHIFKIEHFNVFHTLVI
jgi:hypothetical protein